MRAIIVCLSTRNISLEMYALLAIVGCETNLFSAKEIHPYYITHVLVDVCTHTNARMHARRHVDNRQ